MSIRTKMSIFIMMPIAAVCVLFSIVAYSSQREALLRGVDQKLETAARMAKAVVPPDYHDRVSGVDSVPKEDFMQIVDKFNRICIDMGLQYIWSNLKIGDDIHFTTATSPSKDAAKEDHAHFFEVHRDPSAFTEAFSTMNPVIKEFRNEWGHGRMILLPFHDKQKRPYCFGASMGIETVQTLLHGTVINVMIITGFSLVLGFIISYFLARNFSRPIMQIASFAKDISSGHLAKAIQLRGSTELISLGQSIEVMNRSIQGKMKALREGEEKYKLIAENSADVIYKINIEDEQCIYLSPSIEGMLGYTIEESLSLKGQDILTKESYLEQREWLINVIESGRVISEILQLETVHKDGHIIPVEINATLILDDQGNPIEILGVARDITVRKQAQNALRENEQFLETIIENIPNMIFVKDAKELRFVRFNKAGEDLLGYSRKDLIGKNDYDFFPREEADFFTAKDREVVESGALVDISDEPILTRTKGERRLHTKKIPILDESNRPIYLLGISEDITDRKQIEEQLRQAQKLESIGTLAGGIAHDFNNILFPIVGLSEMLLEDLPSGSLEFENTQEILKAGKRGSDLVKQILVFSRQSEHKMIPVRIQQILKDVLKLSRSTIPSDIKIINNIQSDCGLVEADPTQIHQIAMNLITNAYHALEKSGGEVSVALREIEIQLDDLADDPIAPGRYAMLSVSDTGCGIDPDLIDKIFEPYFTTKAQGKGTGLGLAVVHGIVMEHKGDIKVYSEMEKGTTFNVYLPLMERVVETAPAKKAEVSRTGYERILLVDDEEAIARLEKQMLERFGYKVTSCVSSSEALGAFRANPDAYDLVITDMTMPNMTGDQLAKELISIRVDIPIIVCTGFSERINKESSEAIGIKGFLMKPVVKFEMAQMVREVLDDAKEKS